jgi:signal transduction histidine kinase/DNA-binding response OmpR family regulator
MPVRILHLDDDERDAELVRAHLELEGLEANFDWVKTGPDFERAIDSKSFDLFICDFGVPGYGGRLALTAARAKHPDVPFIFVSGTIGEERAVEAMKAGATDYVLKGNLPKLALVLRRALEEARERARLVLADRCRRAEQRVAEVLSEGAPLIVTARQVLRSLGESFECAGGAVWLPGEDGTALECAATWNTDEADPWLHGRLGNDDQPVWIADLSKEPGYDRGPAAASCGARSAVVCPVRSGARLTAVFELFLNAPRIEDRAVTQSLMASASRFAQFQARAAVESAHLRLANIIEALPDLAALFTPALDLTYLNRAGRQLLGLDDDATRLSARAVFSAAETRRLAEKVLPVVLRSGVWRGTTTLVDRRGAEVPVSAVVLGHGRSGERSQYVSCIAHDLREQRMLEEQYRQAQKMEAFGQLAGGVAHDFNNILSIILGHAELTRLELPPDHPASESVATITRAGQRAAALTRQLLAFSRRQVLQPRVLDLNDNVRESQKMLGRLIGEHVSLVTDLAPDLWRTMADAGQIDQVILNLVVNARDAMPDGGTITIRTANVAAGELPADHVFLSIADTGCGMDERTRARIFEPFFTTKDQGRGTGLGLATVLGIVEQSQGRIDVATRPGSGSTFTVYLPRTESADTAPSLPRASRPATCTETILLVEDEEDVRSLAATLLRRKGYTVLAAESAADALSLCESHPGPIHLVLSDVVMPALSGPELVSRIRARRPDLKVLYMSGYTDDAIGRHGVLGGDVPFLEKPFSNVGLTEAVRDVLDGPSRVPTPRDR